MKRASVLLMIVCACAFAQAGVISVGLYSVDTSYVANSGVLTLAESGLYAVLHYPDQPQDALFNVTFNLSTTRTDGGTFSGGTFELTNADSTVDYLSGTVQSVVFDYSPETGYLSGGGEATVLVENLDGDLLGPAEIVTITFNLTSPVDFESDFTGDSDINFLVPEPATMALLGLGGLSLIRRKR